MATLVTETWTGANGAAWPPGWTVGGTTGFASSIQGNRGRLVTGTDLYATTRADLTGMAAASDTDATVTFYPTAIEAAEEGWFFLRVRGNGVVGSQPWWPETGYQLWIYKNTSNNLQAYIRRYSGNVETTLGATYNLTGPWNTAGMKARLQAVGGTVRFKLWNAADAEPATWAVSAIDGSPLPAGRVGMVTTKGAGAFTRSMDVDDLTVTDGTDTPPPPTAPTVPNTVGSPTNPRTTAGGRAVFKYQIQPDPAVTGTPGEAWLYIGQDRGPGTTAKVCIMAHGYQNWPEDFSEVLGNGGARLLVDKLIDAGYAVILPRYDATFGNADAQSRTLRADTYMRANWTVTGTVILGFSMGGGMGLIAAHRRTLPDLRAVHAIASAIDLVRLGDDSNPYPLSPDLRAAYGAANETQLAVNAADFDPQQQHPARYTGARIRVVTSTADDYDLRPDALTFLSKITPFAAEAVDIDSSPAEHGDAGQWANPDGTVAWFDAAIAAGPWPARPARAADRWTGTALVPQRTDRWTGAELARQALYT